MPTKEHSPVAQTQQERNPVANLKYSEQIKYWLEQVIVTSNDAANALKRLEQLDNEYSQKQPPSSDTSAQSER